MTRQQNGKFMTRFRQIFAAYCVLLADLCILLFYQNLASKSQLLLIKDKTSIFRKSKPNPAKKFFLWRYSDTKWRAVTSRRHLRSKKSYKNNDSFQPLQTKQGFFCEYPVSSLKTNPMRQGRRHVGEKGFATSARNHGLEADEWLRFRGAVSQKGFG
jgi:hypothetical protein